jgi:hypothetical protein
MEANQHATPVNADTAASYVQYTFTHSVLLPTCLGILRVVLSSMSAGL